MLDRIVVKANSDAWLRWNLVETAIHLKGLHHQVILNDMRDAHSVRNAWIR